LRGVSTSNQCNLDARRQDKRRGEKRKEEERREKKGTVVLACQH
jgi:hypothetical protein